MKHLLLALCLSLASFSGFAVEKYQPLTVPQLWEEAVKTGSYATYCQARREGCEMPVVVLRHMEDKNILGLFDIKKPTFVSITTSSVPGSLEWSSLVIHEFTHYLQWLFGKISMASDCPTYVAMEKEAYKVGDKFAERFGLERDRSEFFLWMDIMCSMTMEQ